MKSKKRIETPKDEIDINKIIGEFYKKYMELTDMVKGFPIPAQFQAMIMKEFDTGFLWAKESFHVMGKQSEAKSKIAD